jgi:hypothetical protein
MRLNRGCGCLIFVLAAINLVFSVMAIVSIFSDVELSKPRAWVFVMWCLILAANAAVCVLFGLRSLRPRGDETDAPIEEWTDDDRPD